MKIAVIGGLNRTERDYERLALQKGHEAVFHDGHVGGRGRDALANVVDRCDVVVIVTDVNSHGAVQFARKRMRTRGRTPLLMRRCGLTQFETLLDALSRGEPLLLRREAS